MKPQLLSFGACAIALALTVPALPAIAGVSQEARTACEKAAERVRPALRADEKEAWIANCLADASAGSPPKKDSGY
jgi:hypothetical protein